MVYILDIFRAQIPFPEQVKAVIREHNRWKSWKVGIEDYAYQWALGQQVWEKGIPVFPVKYPGDKVYKAQLATPHFETGRVKMRGVKENGVLSMHPVLRRFLKESTDFPFGESDDCVDAVVGVVLMAMDEELMGQQLAATVTPGFSVAIVGSRFARGGDAFDVFPSSF
jgi:phage terminase large subunit-like protein